MKWITADILLLNFIVLCNGQRLPGFDGCVPIKGFDCVRAGGKCVTERSLGEFENARYFREPAFRCPPSDAEEIVCIFPGRPKCSEIGGKCLSSPEECKGVNGDIVPTRDCNNPQRCCRQGVKASPCEAIGGECISKQQCTNRRDSTAVKNICSKSGEVCCVPGGSKCQRIGGTCVTKPSQCKNSLTFKGICSYNDETCCMPIKSIPPKVPNPTKCQRIGGQCKKRSECIKGAPSRFTFAEHNTINSLCPQTHGYGYGYDEDVCCFSQLSFCQVLRGDCVTPTEKCESFDSEVDHLRLEVDSCNFDKSKTICCLNIGRPCQQIGGECLVKGIFDGSSFCAKREIAYRLGDSPCVDDDFTCCLRKSRECPFCMRFPNPACKIWNFNKIFSNCPDKKQRGIQTACCLVKK